MRTGLTLALALLLFLPASVQAQNTGFPPFGSFSKGQFVSINNQDLNFIFAIPIMSSPGRGLNLGYSMYYNSLVWAPSGGAWVPTNPNNPFGPWGWLLSSHLVGQVSSSYIITYGTCGRLQEGYTQTTITSGYQYIDAMGTAHPFSIYVEDAYSSCTDSDTYSGTYSGWATDGSGYYASIANPANDLTPIITNKSGTVMDVEHQKITDRNGNFMSASVNGAETDWKDTVGRTALKIISGSTSIQYEYLDPSGGYQTTTVNLTSVSIKTNFGCNGVAEYTGTASLPTSVALPNGQTYSFSYEPTPGHSGYYTGRLQKITLPTGGFYQYAYGATNDGASCADGSTLNMTETVSDGSNSATWSYVRSIVNGTTTITTPQLADTPNAFDTVYGFSGPQVTTVKVYKESPGVTLLRTINTTWASNGTPASQVTILEDGTTRSEVDTTYDSNGILDSISQYDWGAGGKGALFRTTTLSYESSLNYRNLNLLGLLTSQVTKDGSQNIVSQTTIAHDETAVASTTGTPQHTTVSQYRGNPTTVKVWTSGTATLNRTFAYFDTGRVSTAADVNGATTTYSYPDATSTCGNTYPTSVTLPLSLSTSTVLNCTGSVATQTTDANGQSSAISFNDPNFWRPTSMTDPTGAAVSYTYPSSPSFNTFEASLPFNGSSSAADVLTTFDGLGRPQLAQRRQAPGSSTFDTVETDFDLTGVPYRTTAPYTGSAGQMNPSGAATVTAFDALGRPTLVTGAGGGTAAYSYSKNDVLVAIGPAPAGENAKQRQFEYDALGRLTSVCEITAGSSSAPAGSCGQRSPQTGYWTKYGYDGAGRLTSVTQNAQAASQQQQSRSYSYDLSGRLLSETNAENGTTSYSYDSLSSDPGCGSVSSNGDLVKRQDAMGNVTCYVHDALHRVTSTTYPSGSYSANTPNKYFVYDAATVNGQAMANAKGRLAEAYTAATQSGTKKTDLGLSYTARGEVADVYESTPNSGGYYHVNATYWANGLVNQLNGGANALPGLPTISLAPDGEGRTSTVSASSGQNPVTATAYNVFGLPTSVTLGSGDSDAFAFDANTGRMTQYKFNIGATPQSVVGNLAWNANGSLAQLQITDPFNSANQQTCGYSHDDLRRIASVNCGAGMWQQNFSYDAFANLTKSVPQGGTGYSFQPTYNPATNRISSLPGFTPSYDANANVLNDSLHQYTWDSEGRPVSIDTVTMTFDALGRTAEFSSSSGWTQVVYSPSGRKLALMNGQTLVKAFVRLPGKAVAVYTSSGLAYYRHSDWLGSSRFASTPSQGMYSDVAYGPFGESYAQAGTTDLSFTGQNSDVAGGSYDFQARQYSIQGRWPSPDPARLAAVNLSDPQTWNRYAYVRNNPLSMVDPLGYDGEDGQCDMVASRGRLRGGFANGRRRFRSDDCYAGGGGGGGGGDGGDTGDDQGGNDNPPQDPSCTAGGPCDPGTPPAENGNCPPGYACNPTPPQTGACVDEAGNQRGCTPDDFTPQQVLVNSTPLPQDSNFAEFQQLFEVDEGIERPFANLAISGAFVVGTGGVVAGTVLAVGGACEAGPFACVTVASVVIPAGVGEASFLAYGGYRFTRDVTIPSIVNLFSGNP